MSPSVEDSVASTPMSVQKKAVTTSLENMERTGMPDAQPENTVTAEEALAQNTDKTRAIARDYNLPKCTMPSESEIRPVEMFVANAMMSQHIENAEPMFLQGYKAIVDVFRRTTDPPMNRMVLIAFRTADHGSVFSKLTMGGETHAQLVHLIFRFDSTRPPQGFEEDAPGYKMESMLEVYKDGSLMDAHLNLILAMVSARTVNLVPALNCVWKMLAEQTSLEEYQVQRLHAMLYTLIRLVPTTRTALFPVIKSRFPHWTKPRETLKYYCIRSFEVLDYLPSIRKEVFELVIDKSLDIDVHIEIKDNGEATIEKRKDEAVEEKDHGELVMLNKADTPMTRGEGSNKVAPLVNMPAGPNEVDVQSNKLDSLLSILFNVLKRLGVNQREVRQLYYEIYPIFESTILTTHKSKFVQYCVFLLCGMESDMEEKMSLQEDTQHSILHRDFASKLVEIIVDPYRATLTRQSGACYLASFVSRASFVGPMTICESIATLLRWAEAYMDSLAADSIRATDAREQSELHALFYTVCQAAFYIMCFRGSDAIQCYKAALAGHSPEGADDDSYLPDPAHIDLGAARWTRICSHELQPLRYCLESVRSEFLHVAHFYELIDADTLERLVIEAKKISTGRVNKKAASKIVTAVTLANRRRKGGVGGLGRGSNPLKSFFPFDPLLLRRSHEIIEPFYKYWEGPVEEDDIFDIDESPGDIFEMDEDNQVPQNSEDEDANEDEEDERSAESARDNDEDDMDSDSESEVESIPSAAAKKETQRQLWTESFKRPRSQSMENGSW